MFLGFNGWIVIVLFYVVVIAILGAALYVVVRLAVLHAMKAHTRRVEQSQRGPRLTHKHPGPQTAGESRARDDGAGHFWQAAAVVRVVWCHEPIVMGSR